MYDEELVTISEEKFVYDSKDLLAWIGGALGLFVGYSFFDLAKYIINIAFHTFYKNIEKKETEPSMMRRNDTLSSN